jgi:hypothetical protein
MHGVNWSVVPSADAGTRSDNRPAVTSGTPDSTDSHSHTSDPASDSHTHAYDQASDSHPNASDTAHRANPADIATATSTNR